METGLLSTGIRSCIIPSIEKLEHQAQAVHRSQSQIKEAIDRLAAESQILGDMLDAPDLVGAVSRLSAQRKKLLGLQKRIQKINNKINKYLLYFAEEQTAHLQ